MKVKDVIKLAESYGWLLDHQTGSHLIYKKPGTKRPLVIPNHGKNKDLMVGTEKSILKLIYS